MAKFIVAIDGGAGSGKSTTAKGVAKKVDFFYLDTGAMYRAVTLKYLLSGGDTNTIDKDLIKRIIATTTVELIYGDAGLSVFLDGRDVANEIRTPEVSRFVSPVSAIPEVRQWMVKKQREIAEGKNIVCEGRDIGTVVFPDAQIKVFMKADLVARARRRQKEMQEKGIIVKLDEVLANLRFRDRYDSSRDHSPLKQAEDAIVIDTTHLTIEQEIEQVVSVIEKHRLAHDQ
ncbi:(d)CMP kinase [candidate division WOR-3 bacterium]|nr:(d)CMP kinase [candidate division WOR-3 bacterium]